MVVAVVVGNLTVSTFTVTEFVVIVRCIFLVVCTYDCTFTYAVAYNIYIWCVVAAPVTDTCINIAVVSFVVVFGVVVVVNTLVYTANVMYLLLLLLAHDLVFE